MLPLSTLDELRDRYMDLLTAVQSGQLPHEQALAQLRSLHAVDGAGARWQITQQGQYMRAGAGMNEAAPADPSEWVTATAAPAAAVGFPSDGAPVPPAGLPGGVPGGLPGGVPGGGGAFPAGLTSAPLLGAGADLFPADSPAVAAAAPAPGKGSKRKKPAKTQATTLSTIESGPKRSLDVAALFEHHKKTLVVVGAGCLLLLAAVLAGGEQIPDDSGIPVAPQSSAPAVAPLPVDSSAPVAPAGNVPTGNDITRVLSALTSGKRDLVQSVVAVPGNEATVSATTALFAGFGPAQFELAPGAAAVNGNAVQSRVEVRDVATKKVYGAFTFTWSKTEQGWRLAAWPAYR